MKVVDAGINRDSLENWNKGREFCPAWSIGIKWETRNEERYSGYK
jgi:hypothetical protein